MLLKSRFLLYLSLFKFRITTNVVLTTFIGFYIGASYQNHFIPGAKQVFVTLFSTALVCAGVCCFNHVAEWKEDLKMERTKNRPIPSGKISIKEANILGSIMVMLGLTWMYLEISWEMMLGAFLTGFLYLIVYTPLKKISWWNTTVGAISGAAPILGGWYAARGYLGFGGLVLFLMMFFWQHTHFYAIAWVCREDYEKAGYIMITKGDRDGSKTFLHSLFHTLFLAVVSFILLKTDFKAGKVYLFGMVFLNFFFLTQVFLLYKKRNLIQAKRVITASIIYLSTMFALFVLDQQWQY